MPTADRDDRLAQLRQKAERLREDAERLADEYRLLRQSVQRVAAISSEPVTVH